MLASPVPGNTPAHLSKVPLILLARPPEAQPASDHPTALDAEALVLAHRIADREARRRRESAANQYASQFLQEWSELEGGAAVAASPFAGYAETYRHARPLAVLAFNLALTESIIQDLCRQEKDPVLLAATASRSVELGLHSLYDPFAPASRPDLFLAAAKQAGYFFTPPDVAFELARGALGDRPQVPRVLDPAAGAGVLLAAVMTEAAASGTQLSQVTAFELDPFAARTCDLVLNTVRDLLALECEVVVETTDAVEKLVSEARDPAGTRWSSIVMNPPYGRVKFLRGLLTNAETRVTASDDDLDRLDLEGKARAKVQAERFREISLTLGLGGGAQDFQRVFKALCLAVMSPGARFAFISSDAWLGDSQSETLRRRVIRERLLEQVTLYPETSGLFATVNQPTAVAVLEDSPRQEFVVRVMSGRSRRESDRYSVTYEEVEALDSERLRVPRVAADLHAVYVKLASATRVRDLPGIKNARGELDLTLGRELIQDLPSSHRLIRGDHVERYVLREPEASKRPSYVDTDGFRMQFAQSPKLPDVSRTRLVGRQCSYQNKPRRLSFALAEPGAVAGNSCNYLVSGDEDNPSELLRLNGLLVLMNSAVLEFFFRLFNANNHVANYEIDELPTLEADSPLWPVLAKQAEFLSAAYGGMEKPPRSALALENIADALVAFGFGLSGDEARLLMDAVEPERAERVAGVTHFLHEHGIPGSLSHGEGWFQHSRPKLSALDQEIIHHVPQGGNWQDIPESVPSARLEQIREMTAWRGVVRTTYYGRLRPDQPSYTIATYYNRPGNGTNIHPWEDRTLTSREAARLQSFPDHYVFAGKEGAIRKQIGNAVPPLLGYALGRHFKDLGFTGPWVDLFAGAGGLSLGLELAGNSVAAALDNNRDAAATYRLNRPCETTPDPAGRRTLVLESDLSQPTGAADALQSIRSKLHGSTVGALVGGPPCQGFSHAGWRSAGDGRNDLAAVFMDFVAELSPELVVLENVEGLLTYEKGRVVRELMTTLKELGYTAVPWPWTLRAETFGVPQMRRRVFLVATKRAKLPTPPAAFTQECKGRREGSSQTELPMHDLPYPVTVAEALAGLPALGTTTHPSFGSRPFRPAYGAWLRGEITAADLVRQLAQPS